MIRRIIHIFRRINLSGSSSIKKYYENITFSEFFSLLCLFMPKKRIRKTKLVYWASIEQEMNTEFRYCFYSNEMNTKE